MNLSLSANSRRAGQWLPACVCLSLLSVPVLAGPVPKNLGNGLDALVAANVKLNKAKAQGTLDKLQLHNGYATKKAGEIDQYAIKDAGGRVLVRVNLNGTVPLALLQSGLASRLPGVSITATDPGYHRVGIFEAYASLDDATALARIPGVSAVHLTLKPMLARTFSTVGGSFAQPGEALRLIGTTFDFGVTQHRVDQIDNLYNLGITTAITGAGVSVGVMSDSFDTSGSAPDADMDVQDQDLPGTGNPINPQPVVVLEDTPGGTDEGRAMTQTVYKMAPKARVAFATADSGEVGFANNIRALAGLSGYTYPDATQAGFKADVICDDVSYLDEPMFSDGVIAQAVDQVAAAGVSYFSSAGNNPGVVGYAADFKFVATGQGYTASTNAALAHTNIDLATVPPELYAGGFQNFSPTGLDVAQTVNVPNSAELLLYGLTSLPVILQWDDPYDTNAPTPVGNAVYTNSGTVTYDPVADQTTPAVFTNVALVAGQEYVINEVPSQNVTGGGVYPLDGVVSLFDPSGNFLSVTDNTSDGDPETVLLVAPVTGNYTIQVDAYEAAAEGYTTSGAFQLSVYKTKQPLLTNDLNLLVFDMEGNYRGALSGTTDNLASNAPVEFASVVAPAESTQLQFVISRANTPPTTGRVASHMKYVIFTDGIPETGPAQYGSYRTPVTFGHSCANGANGVAAYPYFRPNLPEAFTSPGPMISYFNDNGQPLATPQVRLKPDIAAMDGANTSFFGGDGTDDLDTNPNFFGTSDASPHAAAIAALVLNAHGGPGTVSPSQMKSVLQRSAFAHDLDPFVCSGTAVTSEGGSVFVAVSSDGQTDILGQTPVQGPDTMSVTYTGPGSVATLVFNPSGDVSTAGNVTGGQNGLSVYEGTATYFSNSTPGMVFDTYTQPFETGYSSLTYPTDVFYIPSNPAPYPAIDGQFFTLNLQFRPGAFTSSKVLRFTIGRDQLISADVTTYGGTSLVNPTADLLGGGVTIPDGVETDTGMTFSGTTTTGGTFSGVLQNKIGKGYSVVDGFGFINAQQAVSLPLQ